MVVSDVLRRFLEMMWNQIGWNQLKLVVVTKGDASRLAKISIGDWRKDFDVSICNELYAWIEENNDKVIAFGVQKVLLTEFIGPKHDFRFCGMMIFVTMFPGEMNPSA